MFGNPFFPFTFYFQKQFSIFETKKLVWQPKIDRKQKLFSKLNLWRKLKTCKRLFLISSFQNSMNLDKVPASHKWSWNAILLNCWITWIWTEFCSLEAAWIIEDIRLIRDSFSFISFDSIPLRCNRAAKEDEAIV